MVILRAFQSRYFLILKLKILSEVCSVLFSPISISTGFISDYKVNDLTGLAL